jgi:formiminotetrahydrofolate cyclodeaminase
VAEAVPEVAQIAESLKTKTSKMMASDLVTAVALAKAALEGALANVHINLDSMKGDSMTPEDEAFAAEVRTRLSRIGV